MKKILFTGAMAALILSACNSGTDKTSETTVSADTSTTPKMDAAPKMDTAAAPAFSDNDFVMQAANGGMEEVMAGKLAVSQGTSSAVKDLGKMMVSDHTKANNELKTIATKNNITVPAAVDAATKQKLDDLASKKGADFDKAYTAMMEEGHSKTIALFMTEASKGSNADLKAFAEKTLPTLNHHMEMVNSTKDAVNK